MACDEQPCWLNGILLSVSISLAGAELVGGRSVIGIQRSEGPCQRRNNSEEIEVAKETGSLKEQSGLINRCAYRAAFFLLLFVELGSLVNGSYLSVRFLVPFDRYRAFGFPKSWNRSGFTSRSNCVYRIKKPDSLRKNSVKSERPTPPRAGTDVRSINFHRCVYFLHRSRQEGQKLRGVWSKNPSGGKWHLLLMRVHGIYPIVRR